jgi:hypothetical protein
MRKLSCATAPQSQHNSGSVGAQAGTHAAALGDWVWDACRLERLGGYSQAQADGL